MSTHPEPPAATGDPQVDAALHLLTRADPQDLDAQVAAGERLERELAARLKDLAAE
ncbi:MAG: hypothetical protein ACOYBY_17635 [Dermatophilaceae bacterium]